MLVLLRYAQDGTGWEKQQRQISECSAFTVSVDILADKLARSPRNLIIFIKRKKYLGKSVTRRINFILKTLFTVGHCCVAIECESAVHGISYKSEAHVISASVFKITKSNSLDTLIQKLFLKMMKKIKKSG